MSDTTAQRLPAVRRETVEGKVYLILRREILEGRLAGGQRLVQDELAAELGTSRIPVRSALKLLEASGLVTLDRRGFYSVATFDAGDVEEIYTLRMLLEPYAALRALPQLGPPEVRALRAIDERMYRCVDDNDADQWHELNVEFHMAIYAASGQPRLIRIIRDLWFGRPSFSPIKTADHMRRSIDQHEAILAAVEARNEADLETRVRDHIGGARSLWTSFLSDRTRAGAS